MESIYKKITSYLRKCIFTLELLLKDGIWDGDAF